MISEPETIQKSSSTHFFPRAIRPYITPVVKMNPHPIMLGKFGYMNTAGRAIL